MISSLKRFLSSTKKTKHTAEEKDNMQRNEASVISLHFEMFKQFAWLGSATIGALVILIQLNVLELGPNIYKAIGAVAASILLSVFGQFSLVSSLSIGKSVYEIRSAMTIYTVVILFVFGLGIGFALPR